jgi:DNA repair protein RecO (recombination protein O)
MSDDFLCKESYTSEAVVLRRKDYMDYDVIVTLFTYDRGIVSVIAKNARKSVKRFSGVLELFTNLNVVIKPARAISWLEEASIENPFEKIRLDITKTAYASYFSEIIVRFNEENQADPKIYVLFLKVLCELSAGTIPPETLSILFHVLFLYETGHLPEFTQCIQCDFNIADSLNNNIFFDIKEGGIVCEKCHSKGTNKGVPLSLGTIRLLQWVLDGTLEEAMRLKFPKKSVSESLTFTEKFLSYHLGREPSSLLFLKKIRKFYGQNY